LSPGNNHCLAWPVTIRISALQRVEEPERSLEFLTDSSGFEAGADYSGADQLHTDEECKERASEIEGSEKKRPEESILSPPERQPVN